MPTYIAMLRGINVSGHKIIPMQKLRELCEELGLRKVRTYIQSGNVVFEAAKTPETKLADKIAKGIEIAFGFDVWTLVISPENLRKVIAGNPFVKEPGIDVARLHVTFLAGEAPKGAVELLLPLASKTERLHAIGAALYLHLPDGSGNSKISNLAIEKKFALRATTRNWRTCNTLLEMAEAE